MPTDAADRDLVTEAPTPDQNPGHHTRKRDTEPPRGAGDGELMEQPASSSEAREPGAEPRRP